MTSGIYRIDLGNGWFYIGSAVNLKRREREHRRRLKDKSHHNQKMKNIWKKHSVFKFTILEQCTVNELISQEQIYLDKHFNDIKNINFLPKAGSALGVVRSLEYRAKMSAAKKGTVLSAETRAKLSACRKGKKHSVEARAKISAYQKNRIHSAETRAKMSASQKGRVVSAETRAKLVAAWAARKAQAA